MHLLQAAKRSVRQLASRAAHDVRAACDRAPKLVFVVYHRVLPDASFNPAGTIVTVEALRRQLETIRRTYPVIALSEAVRQCRQGVARARVQVVLTFDDGYLDNYELAFPLLRGLGLPAAFFVVTDAIGTDGPVWDWDVLCTLLREERLTEVAIDGALIRQGPREPRTAFAFRVLEQLKGSPREAARQVCAALRREAGPFAQHAASDLDRAMTWEQLRVMRRHGMEIGSHGATHRSLARIDPDDAKRELTSSRRAIEARLASPCRHFAFPFGSARDYTPTLVDTVRQAGFDSGLLNIHGYNYVARETFCFKRVIMTQATNARYLLG
jgi:peptidoglycan/xylan/chitin deacetylase (PgdA/CDA1 family)